MKKYPLACLLGATVLTIIILLLASLYATGGQFFYTLDDPYISLRLAERIAAGEYGLNPGEFASPSSNILWPFLLVPLVKTPLGVFVPLIVNSIACLLTAAVIYRTLRHIYPRRAALLAYALMLFTNSFGLVFTGMEHSVQILVAAVIVGAMIDLVEKRPLSAWLMPALIIGPMIRYEMLSVGLGAVGLLFLYRQYKYLLGAAIPIAVMAVYSYFLWTHTGSLLPASIHAKMTLFGNSVTGSQLIILEMALIGYALVYFRRRPGVQLFCAYMFAVLSAHLYFAKSGSFSRYEIYALISAGMALLYYLPSTAFGQLLKKKNAPYVSLFFLVLIFCTHLFTTLSTPAASYSIYAQQGQMRRLAEEAGFPDIAVNDIGYLSFRNNAYVFDTLGLGRLDMQAIRLKDEPEWLSIVDSKHAPLVMIYDAWHNANSIPGKWVKLGMLEFVPFPYPIMCPLGALGVSIYATSPKAKEHLEPVIAHWQQSLPPHAVWHPNVP